MNTLHHFPFAGSSAHLLDSLQQYGDAGIDPAFDSDLEELERQFAEYRVALAND